jgi:hypothetical protein
MHIFVFTANYELRVSRKSHLRDHPTLGTTFFLGTTQGLCTRKNDNIKMIIFSDHEK